MNKSRISIEQRVLTEMDYGKQVAKKSRRESITNEGIKQIVEIKYDFIVIFKWVEIMQYKHWNYIDLFSVKDIIT